MIWENLFEEKVLKRGYGYCYNRAVIDMKTTKEKITAVVNGSDLYDVEIDLENGIIANMHCTCPYAQNGKNCKHMAAVLYKWERNKKFDAAEKVAEKVEDVKQDNIISDNDLVYGDEEYYGKFYPNKILAMKELRINTGMGLTEAKEIIEELFEKIEALENNDSKKQKVYSGKDMDIPPTPEVNQNQTNNGDMGCCLVSLFMLIFYLPFRILANLVKRRY